MLKVIEIIEGLMIIIRVGVALRVIYCLMKMTSSDDEAPGYKKKAINTLKFYVLAELIWQIKDLILSYYT